MIAHQRRAAVRNHVLLALVVLIGGWAAWRLLMQGGSIEDAAPDDAASAVSFICEGCGNRFDLTQRQIEDAQRNRDIDSDPQTRMMKFRCPQCNEKKGVRGRRCPQHGDVIKLAPGPNDPRSCSKCSFPRESPP
jgi:predicted RNA-binding Zn-ribbon protein involved in translation (DUF1610 family)